MVASINSNFSLFVGSIDAKQCYQKNKTAKRCRVYENELQVEDLKRSYGVITMIRLDLI